jgi:uncharacterized membrane protein
MEKIRAKTSKLFDTVYDIGVIIKGIDGFIELISGIALFVSPKLVHIVLIDIVGRAASHGPTHVHHLIAQYVAGLDNQLAASGLTFLIIFLIGHGLVKLGLVYCLLKKIVRAYPVALIILTGFLVYQVYAFIRTPSIGMAFFCVLDGVIIGLVWHEYRVLVSEKVV